MGWYDTRRSRVAYEGVLSRVRVDEVAMPDGTVSEREVVEHPDAVAVVAVDDHGQVLLLRQYRHPFGSYLLELPAGKRDEGGESAADTAHRELVEEVGIAAGDLTELVTFHNSSGWADESTTVYLATALRPADAPEGFTPAHEEADMEVLRLPLPEAASMCLRGEVPDAKTLIGLLLADERLRQKE